MNIIFAKWPFLLFLLPSAAALFAGTFVGGLEDTPGEGYEKTGDYNDMMFTLSGNIAVNSPGAAFNDLTPNLVNEDGSLYFDQHSYDGADYNIGYCVMNMGACHLPIGLGDMRYLAGASGAAPQGITFHADGPVTFTLLLDVTSNYRSNTLGWYDPADPGNVHLIFTGLDSPGAAMTVNLNGNFVFFSENGLGQIYSSVAAANVNEAADHQHFALFQDPPSAAVAEPASMLLVGLALIGGALCARRACHATLGLHAGSGHRIGVAARGGTPV